MKFSNTICINDMDITKKQDDRKSNKSIRSISSQSNHHNLNAIQSEYNIVSESFNKETKMKSLKKPVDSKDKMSLKVANEIRAEEKKISQKILFEKQNLEKDQEEKEGHRYTIIYWLILKGGK